MNVSWAVQLAQSFVPEDDLLDRPRSNVQLSQRQICACQILVTGVQTSGHDHKPFVNQASAGLRQEMAPMQFSTEAACCLTLCGRVFEIGVSSAAALSARFLDNTRALDRPRHWKDTESRYESTIPTKASVLKVPASRYSRLASRTAVLFSCRSLQCSECVARHRPQVHTQLVRGE